MMKRKLLSAAVASAVVSGPAVAFDPTLTAPEYTIVISGATAPTDSLNNVLSFTVCDSDIDRFNNGSHYSVACVVKNIAGQIAGLPAAGRRVLFLKNNGGSGTGAGALQNNLTVTLSGPTSRASCTSSVTVAAPKLHRTNTGCPANLTSLGPDWGISDVEPTIFVGDLAPPASEGGPFIPGGPALTVKNLAGLGFGFNVTLGLYRALQFVQFADASVCNPEPNAAKAPDGNDDDGDDFAGAIAGDGISDAYQQTGVSDATTPPTPKAGGAHRRGDTRACMPNLSRWEVNQILVGNVPTTLELVDSSTGLDLFSASIGKPWEAGDPLLNICRRRSGSGTHAQTSIFFLGTQCGPNGQSMVAPPLLAGQRYENVGSGNLDRCLNGLDQDVAVGGPDTVPNIAPAGYRRWAAGYQSVEKNADFSGAYRFIKIDGRAPTLVEEHAGNYLNFGEVTMQIRAAQNYNDPDIATNGEVAAVTQMFNYTAASITDPAAVTGLNAGGLFNQPFGNAGFLIDPDPFGANGPVRTPDITFSAANPVGSHIHQVPGGVQNSCLIPQKGAAGVTPQPVDL